MMELFGVMPDSEPVSRITLNHRRLSASILTYGATMICGHPIGDFAAAG